MKKLFVSVLWIIIVLIAFSIGISMKKHFNKDELVSNETVIAETKTKTEQTFDESIVEIPISDVEIIAKQSENGLTMQEAELLCGDVLGDKAEENGFPISYRCISAVSANDKLYYVMHITWLVNDNHWSYIGNCYVSFDGKEIYDGSVSPERYEITKLRWEK